MESSSSGVSEDEDRNELVSSRKHAALKGCLKESTDSKNSAKKVCFAQNTRGEESETPPPPISGILPALLADREKLKKKQTKTDEIRKIRVASEKTVRSVMAEIDTATHTIHHFCLSWSMQDANFKPTEADRTHHVFASSGSNMCLYPSWEKDLYFSAGVCDLIGMATCAGNIVSILHQDPSAVVVVSDRHGKDYAPLVCRFACILAKTISASLFDRLREGCPLPKHPLLRRWVKTGGVMTECKSLEALLQSVERLYFAPIASGGLDSFDIRPTTSELNVLMKNINS